MYNVNQITIYDYLYCVFTSFLIIGEHMKKLTELIDPRFRPDKKLCENKAYRTATLTFNNILSTLESRHPEDKELIDRLIVARAVLETVTARHMFRKGLNNKWKIRNKKKEK